MAKVFVDTVAWIALVNNRDFLHEESKQILSDLRRQNYKLITTEFVLLEFANALSSPELREKTSNFIEGLQTMKEIEIVSASSELFAKGFELYKTRLDKEWSIVDCSSFVVMEEMSITKAFTQDHHFEQAGFVKLI
jgi:uncharacterized protein